MSFQDYANFELNIELLDGNKIRVTVVDSPTGSVSADVANPFSPDDIAQIIAALDGSVQISRINQMQTARTFGEKLFATIFTGEISNAYVLSLQKVGEGGLRIRLGLDNAGFLRQLPWELLRDPRGDYLALSKQTALVRYPRLLETRPPVEVKLPLRVLVLISSPADQPTLDVEAEWRALQESTADLRSRGLLEIERIDDAQLITLQRKLRGGVNYQIFHYIGHAAFSDRSQTGMLAFENPATNTTAPVSGEALARELVEENSIRLVVLNACQGARQNDKDQFAGIASSIVARGVPAVVAMQFSISDYASRVFSQEFYKALSENYPIEAALAEARRAISSTMNNTEWATPVLFLRGSSGVLFPKRVNDNARLATGGLRELLMTPMGIGAAVLSVLVVAMLVFLFRPQPPPVNVTPTVTPSLQLTPGSADLAITNVLFRPSIPAPGESFTVTILVTNAGPDPVSQFKLTWIVQGQGANRKAVESLFPSGIQANQPLNATGHVRFGWWGSYQSTALITSTDSRISDPNPGNQVISKSITLSNRPFDIDFQFLPVETVPFGDEPIITASRDLKGDEFSLWGFLIKPVTTPGDNCNDAISKILFLEDGNQLVTGQPGKDDTCRSLPLAFMITPPKDNPVTSIGGAAVEFLTTTPGTYSLEIYGDQPTPIQTSTVDSDTPNALKWVRAPKTGKAINGIRKVIFRPPAGAATVVMHLLLYFPDNPMPDLPVLPTP